jgi:1-acyl-sn-glycerol-3-phosphate acyltransferase
VIRSIWTLGVGAVSTFWFAGRLALMAYMRRENALCKHCDLVARAWARSILWAAGVKVHLQGEQNFVEDGAQLIVSNHESWFDLFALLAVLPVKTRFVAKKELLKVPLFGTAWRACGHVPIDRSNRKSAIESLEEAGRHINEGKIAVLMFAEGTRTDDGSLGQFKKGAFVLGIQAGAPIVPVALIGTRPVMPKGSFRIRGGDVQVHVGRPISVEGLQHADRDVLAERVRAAVADLRGGEGPTSLLPGEVVTSSTPLATDIHIENQE